MPKRLQLEPHLSCDDLQQRYRQATDSVERTHYQILWLLSCGKTTDEIAQVTSYSLRWIRVIVNRYNQPGEAGVGDQRHHNRGAPRLLDDLQQAQLLPVVAAPVNESGLVNGRKVAEWMSRVLERPVAPQRGWEYLKQMEYCLRVARPAHTQADLSEQDGWKRTCPASGRAT